MPASGSNLPSSVCVILRDFAIGGVPRLYIDLVRRLGEAGIEAAIVAAPGPLGDLTREQDVDAIAVDWNGSRAVSGRIVRDAASRFDAAVVLCDPQLLHAVPAALAGAGRALLVVHSQLPSLAEWFGHLGLARLRATASGLSSSGAGAVVARGRPHQRAISALLDIDSDRIPIVPPGVATDAIPFDPKPASKGGSETVLVLSRLSPETEPRLRAGVELVSAGLERGRNCRLRLVGDGPHRDIVFDLCRRTLPPDRWTHEPWTLDPVGCLRDASVVAASNLTALEAVAVGRRVVVARRAGDGHCVGPVLRPENFESFSGDIFGTDVPPVDPHQAWEDLDRVVERDLAELRSLVEASNSSGAQLEALLATLGRLEPLTSTAGGLVGEWATIGWSLEDELAELRVTADELWEARGWYEGQLAAAGLTSRAPVDQG
jgi:hypothetical protein